MIKNVFFAQNKKLASLLLTFLIFLILFGLLFEIISIANIFNSNSQILPKLIPIDILFGIFIYLKTSVDFIVYAASFVKKHTKKDLSLFSLGTSIGNGIGMFLVIFIWAFIKNVKILLLLAVVIASLFLIFIGGKETILFFRDKVKNQINENLVTPTKNNLDIFLFSIRLPFILGIDDFAGYIPLFNILNVTSFATGVLLGHFILVSLILINESLIRKIVEFKFFDLIGGLVFLGIGLWGIIEAFNLF